MMLMHFEGSHHIGGSSWAGLARVVATVVSWIPYSGGLADYCWTSHSDAWVVETNCWDWED